MVLLMVEFLDELIFGVREAAWPLIRDDLHLTYLQIGLILSVPGIISSLVEPVFGILSDTWNRRVLILGGGVFFTLAVLLTAASYHFLGLLLSFVLFYPASGAFVSLSQAALMDAEPARREQNMARWTFAGSLGVAAGPLILSGTVALGGSWRNLFLGLALLALLVLGIAWRCPFQTGLPAKVSQPAGKFSARDFWAGLRGALVALRRLEVLRWLVLLQFADLMLDVLYGYLALYCTDVAGVSPVQAGLGVAVWTGAGLLGDFMLIPLLERVKGLQYLRVSAAIVLVLFPAFLLVPHWNVKLLLVGMLGILNSGWYAIPKGQLYAAMPGRSGAVMTLDNVFGLLGSQFPLLLGWFAQHYGLQNTFWILLLGPLVLIMGLPGFRSKIT
jgi:FSR family fosmidomycin resistance protein-like MFS transporter